jgi:branched-chain amino acid transport system substrate-binding protein
MLGQAASYDSAIAVAPGGITEGFYSMTPMLFVAPDDPRPAVHDFIAKYKSLYGSAPNFAAQIGYVGAQLTALALQNAGKDLTADGFVKGMESIKDYHDIFGSPPMSFSATKHQGSDQSFLAVVHDGKWVPVDTSPVAY